MSTIKNFTDEEFESFLKQSDLSGEDYESFHVKLINAKVENEIELSIMVRGCEIYTCKITYSNNKQKLKTLSWAAFANYSTAWRNAHKENKGQNVITKWGILEFDRQIEYLIRDFGNEIIESVKFKSFEELLSVPWVKYFQMLPEFYRWSIEKYGVNNTGQWLVAEFEQGQKSSVIGLLHNDILSLPRFKGETE